MVGPPATATRPAAPPPALSDTRGVADSEAATTIRRRTRRVFASPFGAVYDFYIRRERLSQLIARFAWHRDVRPFYASMAAIPCSA